MNASALAPAAQAFDAIAAQFDDRFLKWRSVEAQRRAIRNVLIGAFPRGARLVEIGGGTGEDAFWLADQGREVLMTDASPAMICNAAAKCGERVRMAVAAAEDLRDVADKLAGEPLFDGAYSVFAALNCVSDVRLFGEGIARLLRPGAQLILVVFGILCPGEFLVEMIRGRPRNALRRLRRGDVPARLGGREFTVRYHRRAELQGVLRPWFKLKSRRGIGIFVPPSAAEPWISSHPHLLATLEAMDRLATLPLAALGDHTVYRFERTRA